MFAEFNEFLLGKGHESFNFFSGTIEVVDSKGIHRYARYVQTKAYLQNLKVAVSVNPPLKLDTSAPYEVRRIRRSVLPLQFCGDFEHICGFHP
jgi:hypothetical protein